MKTLNQQIEEMRAHVRDLARTERALVKRLGDELRRADDELLKAIRRVSAEHEQRRSLIMVELQELADRARLLPEPGSGRGPPVPVMQLRDRARPALSLYGAEGPLTLEEEVSYHLKGRTPCCR